MKHDDFQILAEPVLPIVLAPNLYQGFDKRLCREGQGLVNPAERGQGGWKITKLRVKKPGNCV